jgi:hypothetical protein
MEVASVTTLNIHDEEKDLRDAEHLLLSEIEGTVSVVSTFGETHTYSFV